MILLKILLILNLVSKKNIKIIKDVQNVIIESIDKRGFRKYYELLLNYIPLLDNVFIAYYLLISGVLCQSSLLF